MDPRRGGPGNAVDIVGIFQPAAILSTILPTINGGPHSPGGTTELIERIIIDVYTDKRNVHIRAPPIRFPAGGYQGPEAAICGSPGRPRLITRRPERSAASATDYAGAVSPISAARAIDDARQRAEALAAVAKLLPIEKRPRVVDEALAIARGIDDAGQRATALAAVAQRLLAEEQLNVLGEALTAARRIDDARRHAGALVEVAELLGIGQISEFSMHHWMEAARILAMRNRPNCIAALAEILPLLDALGVELDILEIAIAKPQLFDFLWMAPIVDRDGHGYIHVESNFGLAAHVVERNELLVLGVIHRLIPIGVRIGDIRLHREAADH